MTDSVFEDSIDLDVAPGTDTDAEAATRVFEVMTEDADTRLDRFLAARIEGWSRSRLQRAIEDGDVLVQGQVVKSSYKLSAGESVEIELAESPLAAELTPEDIPLSIVYEDDDLVVVDKPAGLVVHPGSGVRAGTLANALSYHFAHLPTGSGRERPGIVHRLDRDTSGLLIVAKNETAHEHLANQFRERLVRKWYVALVHGVVAEEAGRADAPIGRDRVTRTKMAIVPIGRGGRQALTLFKVKQRFERMTLLDVEIKTGRTHQIRVHLASLRYPVVGDALYNGGRDRSLVSPKLRAAVARLDRQFLHAARLAFTHPRTSEHRYFTSELPNDLALLLDELT